jgi:cell pole-organizing protein PopZ
MSFTNNDIHNAAGPGSSAEPSMEEILASIRRILKEDDPGKPDDPASMDMDDDILLLDQSMIARPADVSTATILPMETAPMGEPPAAPLQPANEPLHFSSEPVPFGRDFGATARTMPEPVVELPPDIDPEPQPLPPSGYENQTETGYNEPPGWPPSIFSAPYRPEVDRDIPFSPLPEEPAAPPPQAYAAPRPSPEAYVAPAPEPFRAPPTPPEPVFRAPPPPPVYQAPPPPPEPEPPPPPPEPVFRAPPPPQMYQAPSPPPEPPPPAMREPPPRPPPPEPAMFRPPPVAFTISEPPRLPDPPRPPPAATKPPPSEPQMNDASQNNFQPPESLISDKTTDAAASSIGALVRSMSTEKAVTITKNSAVTIEDVVREEIRPLLKSWLDTHLPSLVERVVRSEIERVINRTVV